MIIERAFAPHPCIFCGRKNSRTWLLKLKQGNPLHICDACKDVLRTICQLEGIPFPIKGLESWVK